MNYFLYNRHIYIMPSYTSTHVMRMNHSLYSTQVTHLKKVDICPMCKFTHGTCAYFFFNLSHNHIKNMYLKNKIHNYIYIIEERNTVYISNLILYFYENINMSYFFY